MSNVEDEQQVSVAKMVALAKEFEDKSLEHREKRENAQIDYHDAEEKGNAEALEFAAKRIFQVFYSEEHSGASDDV